MTSDALSAANTSAMVARRPSSDLRSDRSLSSSGLSRPSVSAIRSSVSAQPRRAVDQGLVELAPVLADGVDLFLELGLGFRSLFLARCGSPQLLVALAQRIELDWACKGSEGRRGVRAAPGRAWRPVRETNR